MRLLIGLLLLVGAANAAPVSLESAQLSAARLRLPAAQLPQDQQALIERLDSADAAVVSRTLRELAPWALFDYRIEGAIADYAEDGNKPDALRALAWKCLYDATANPDARARLLAQLQDADADLELRQAAAWGLWEDSGRSAQTRLALMTTALDLGEPETLRLEAAKSLYLGMQSWDARDAALELAQDSGAPEGLRAAAILLLHAVRQDWKVQPALQELSQSAAPALRQAAQTALTPGTGPELARFFHLGGLPN